MHFKTLRWLIALGVILSIQPVMAEISWDNETADAQWSTPANWSGNHEPTSLSEVQFSLSTIAGTVVTLESAEEAATLSFLTNGYVLEGGDLRLSTGTISVGAGVTATLATTLDGNTISKAGGGTLIFSESNTYSGATSVNAGVLNIRNDYALGDYVMGTTVASGAALELEGGVTVDSETLTINGTGISSGGALRSVSGDNSFNGLITLAASSRIRTVSNSTLTLHPASGNALEGSFTVTLAAGSNSTISVLQPIATSHITKDLAGTAILAAANTHTGSTTVSAGILNVQHDLALGSTNNGTSVTSGATLALDGSITISNEALTLRGNGVEGGGALRSISGENAYQGLITLAADSRIHSDLDLLILHPSSGSAITGNFNVTFGGDANITVGQPIATGNGSLIKDGNGTLTLDAVNTYTGATIVNDGKLIVNGSISGSALTINNGATVTGSGSLGAFTLNSGGIIAPGESPGFLNTGTILLNGGTLALELHGATPGVQYDQINVAGDVSISLATALMLSFGPYDPPDDGSQSFTIINNDLLDAILLGGLLTIDGQPLFEGGHFVVEGQPLVITYAGGLGNNDVVLTAVPEPTTTILLLGGGALFAGFRTRRQDR